MPWPVSVHHDPIHTGRQARPHDMMGVLASGGVLMAWRAVDQAAAKAAIVAARRAGLTLVRASAAAGVHVATACRWQAADRQFASTLKDAEHEAHIVRRRARCTPPQSVPFHSSCPVCWSGAEVVKAWALIPFWRCSRWPDCRWASWRPRFPSNCRVCGGARFWSHSRLSVSCSQCRTRKRIDWE